MASNLFIMSRVCQITGKKAMVGNNVSHSNKKTKRKFNINLIKKKFFLSEENRWVTLKVSASALRTVDKKGGLDLYLLSADETLLSRNALKIKKDIETLEEVKEK